MKRMHEGFAKFFENPTREGFRELIKYNTGEYNQLDFKKSWPEFTKIARHVLAFANTCGGCIVFGVEEKKDKSLNACGLDKLIDKAEISRQLKMFIPEKLETEVIDFDFKDSEYPSLINKKFQVLFIEYDQTLIPFVSKAQGNGIRKNAIYVREGTSSSEVNYMQLQQVLNKRISTNLNTSSKLELEEHLQQLKVLYDEIPQNNIAPNENSPFYNIGASIVKILGNMNEKVPNPNYPEEDYELFVLRMIENKKKRIEHVLDL